MDVGRPPRVVRQVVGVIVHRGVRLDVEGETAAEDVARIVETEMVVGEPPQTLRDRVPELERHVELGDAGADIFREPVLAEQSLNRPLAAVGPRADLRLRERDLLGGMIEQVVFVFDRFGRTGFPVVNLGVEMARDDIDLLMSVEGSGGLLKKRPHDVVTAVSVGGEAVFKSGDGTAELHVFTHAGGDELVVNALVDVDVFLGAGDLVIDGDVGLVADLPVLRGEVERRRLVALDQKRDVGGDRAGAGVAVEIEESVVQVLLLGVEGRVGLGDRAHEERRSAGVDDMGDADVHVGQAEALVRIDGGADHAHLEGFQVFPVVRGDRLPERTAAEVYAELADADVVDDVGGVDGEGGLADDQVAGPSGEHGGERRLERGRRVGRVGREHGAGLEQAPQTIRAVERASDRGERHGKIVGEDNLAPGLDDEAALDRGITADRERGAGRDVDRAEEGGAVGEGEVDRPAADEVDVAVAVEVIDGEINATRRAGGIDRGRLGASRHEVSDLEDLNAAGSIGDRS